MFYIFFRLNKSYFSLTSFLPNFNRYINFLSKNPLFSPLSFGSSWKFCNPDYEKMMFMKKNHPCFTVTKLWQLEGVNGSALNYKCDDLSGQLCRYSRMTYSGYLFKYTTTTITQFFYVHSCLVTKNLTDCVDFDSCNKDELKTVSGDI